MCNSGFVTALQSRQMLSFTCWLINADVWRESVDPSADTDGERLKVKASLYYSEAKERMTKLGKILKQI